MVDQKELQEKILTYRILQSKLDETVRQRELIINKMAEVENTLASVDESQKSEKETLFPLGSETYVFGKTTNKEKMLVGIGANIILEKTFEEGKGMLNNSKAELEKALKEIQDEMNRLSASIEELTPQLQKMMEQSQQAG